MIGWRYGFLNGFRVWALFRGGGGFWFRGSRWRWVYGLRFCIDGSLVLRRYRVFLVISIVVEIWFLNKGSSFLV